MRDFFSFFLHVFASLLAGRGKVQKRDKKRDKKCLKMRFIVMKSKMFTSYNRSKISTESKNM